MQWTPQSAIAKILKAIKEKKAAPVVAKRNRKPHQGEREMARRRRQMEKARMRKS